MYSLAVQIRHKINYFEDRLDLLGHRSGRITTHYSAAELSRLIDAVNGVCFRGQGKPEPVVLRRLSVS